MRLPVTPALPLDVAQDKPQTAAFSRFQATRPGWRAWLFVRWLFHLQPLIAN